MTRKLLLVLVGLSTVLAGFAAPAQTRRVATQRVVVQKVDLQGLKGLLARDPKNTRPLLVNFWATWCDPCRDEFPDLVKIDNEYRPKGLNFISISLDDPPDIATAVPDFLGQMHATMPAYLLNVSDPEPAINAVDREWGGALPATFLYDAEGKVVFKHFGRVNAQDLRAAIDKLVDSKQ
jgi:thiol-disulfide isomerase/thioredoxin